MPRYFLNIRVGGKTISDEEGIELEDLDAARNEAIIGAREILADNLRDGLLTVGQQIEIADQSGAVLAVVAFTDAFTVVKS